MAILVALLVVVAQAATLPTMPGRAVVILPCDAEPAAPCWDQATKLERFAPQTRVLAAPLVADVRLASKEGKLLVRVGALPADTTLEVSVSGAALAAASSTRIDRAGVITLPLGKVEKGEPRSLWMNLVSDGVTRPWAPAGPGELQEPI